MPPCQDVIAGFTTAGVVSTALHLLHGRARISLLARAGPFVGDALMLEGS